MTAVEAMEGLLNDQRGNEVRLFTLGQVVLPSGGQIRGTVEVARDGLVTLSVFDDRDEPYFVHINIAHIVRLYVEN